MKTVVLPLSVLAFLTASISGIAAEELHVKAAVFGRRVEVQVRRADGRPVAGANVRLLYGRQLAEAVSRTDSNGCFAHTVSRTGAYEAVVETEENTVRTEFLVLDDSDSTGVHWWIVGPGLGCIVAAVCLGVMGARTAGRKGVRFARASGLSGAVLFLSGSCLLAWSAWGSGREQSSATDPDVAAEARAYLAEKHVKPLSESLEELLADASKDHEKTQPHPLLGQPAPGFDLPDHRQKGWQLHDHLAHGPVVLIFYYGYHCNHCVGQLFALHDDIRKFRELGATVIAVSADPPELTKQRFRQYGEFAFPVLSDPGNKIAQAYGVYQPPAGDKREELQHGTFVIGRDGRVAWANFGNEPFTGNRTLLYELARLENRLPEGKRE
jgi:peroxiredoxin